MNSKLFCLFFLFLTIYNTYDIHAQPTLVEPKSGFVTINSTVIFIWNKAEAATNYDIQIDDDSLFSSPIQQTGLLINSYTANLPQFQKYYWRVRYNNAGNPSPWSDVWNIELYNLPANTNLKLWLKVDAGITNDTTGNVLVWNDQTANGNNAIQLDTSRSPNLSNPVSLINNYKSVSFDGANDYLRITHNSSLDLGTAETVFFVADFVGGFGFFSKRPDTAGNTPGIEFRKSASNLVFVHRQEAPNAGNVNLNVPYPTGLNMLSMARNNTVGLYKKNGGYITPTIASPGSNINVNNTRPLDIGAGRNLVDYFQGAFSEILTYNTSLDSNTIVLVEKYLRYKYAPPVNLGEDILVQTGFCDTVTLDASERFVSYKWSDSSTTSTIKVTASGNYWVSATDVFGNISYDTITVTYPSLALPQTTEYCKNDSVLWDSQLSSNDYTFEWSTGATTGSIYISTPDNYWVKATETANPLCIIYSDTLTFQQDIFQDIATLGPDDTLCSGNSIGLVNGASLAQTYLWAPGNETTASIIVFADGDYLLTATSVSGCVVTDTIHVYITGDAPTVAFSHSGSCKNDTTFFDNDSEPAPGDAITGYEWDFGDSGISTDTNPTHIYTSPGNYIVSLKVFTSLGCLFINSDTVKIYDTPTAYHEEINGCRGILKSFTDMSMAGNGDSLNYFYWNFGDNAFALSQHPSHTYVNDDTFTVTLAVGTINGCVDTFYSQIEILPPVDPLAGFTLIAPNNNFNMLLLDSINFVWNEALGVFLYYELQISSTPDFSTLLNSYAPLTSDSFKTIGDSSWSPKIFWRVVGYNLCEVPTYSNVYSINFYSPPANMNLWLMANKNISSGVIVNSWLDNSGIGNNAFQSNPGRNPAKSLVPAINNMPAVKFSGNEFLTIADNASQIFNSEITALFVLRTDSSIAGQTLFNKKRSGGTDPGLEYAYSSTKQFSAIHQGQTQNVSDRVTITSPFFEGWNMLRMRRSNTNGSIYLNSVQRQVSINPAANGVNTTSPDSIDIGVGRDGNSNFFNGEIAEMMLFNRSINNAEALAAEDYLNDKYAPPVNLGPDIYIKYGLCYNIVLDASERFLEYHWSNGETTSTININQSGIYSVTVTNIFGRISSDTVIINVPGLASPPSSSFCLGDSITWNIPLDTSLYDIEWSTGSPDSFIIISTPGEYWVKITDTNFCSKQDTFIIVSDSFEVLVDIGPDTSLCEGNSIKLFSGQQPGNSYLWSTGSTADSTFITSSGDYSVTAINANGCAGIDTVLVNVIGVAPTVVFNSYSTCFGDTTYFEDNSVSANPIVEWDWQFGDNDSSSIENPPHLYGAMGYYLVTLTVTSDVGCVSSASQSLDINPKPVPDFTNSVSCAGTETQFNDVSTITGLNSVQGWRWYFGTGATDSVKSPLYSFPGEGEYEVTITAISDRGCADSITKTVEVFKELNADFETSGVTCFGDSTKFNDKTNSFSVVKYLWEFFDVNTITSTVKNPSYTFQGTGTYNVKLAVTNAIGCVSDTVKEVTIFDAPVADFNFAYNCIGQLTQFTDTSDAKGDTILKHFWNFGDSTQTVRAFNPIYIYDSVGTYNVSHNIVTVSGCEASVSKNVSIVPLPTADFSYSPDFGAAPLPVNFVNESSSDAISFLWNFGDADSSVSQAENPTHTYTVDNTYTAKLVVGNSSGCTDSITKTIKVAKATLDIAVTNVIVQQDLMNDGNYRLITVAEVQNLGTRNVTAFDISCITGTQPAILESWEGFLTAGGSSGSTVNYAFASSFISLEEENTTYVCVETLYPNGEEDENRNNDKLCVALEDKIKVIPPYPSPGKGTLYFGVILPRKDKLEITMFNAIGAEIFTSNREYAKGYNRIQFERSGLAKGVYIIRIKFGEDTYTEKFITE